MKPKKGMLTVTEKNTIRDINKESATLNRSSIQTEDTTSFNLAQKPGYQGNDLKTVQALLGDKYKTIVTVHNDIAIRKNSLKALKKLHRSHSSMDALLKTTASIVTELLEAEHCSICSFVGTELHIRVRMSHNKKGAKTNPERVIEMGHNYLNTIRFNQAADNKGELYMSEYCIKRTPWEVTAPIRDNKQIAGYIYVQRDKQLGSKFSKDEIDLFHDLSEHIDAAIDTQRIRDLLACPSMALAIDYHTTISNDLIEYIESTLQRLPVKKETIVKTIAQRFYRDLHRTGFETKHIISAATEIVHNLSESLRNNNSVRAGNH